MGEFGELKNRLDETISEVVKKFEEKQELNFEFAVGDDLLDVLDFNGIYYFTLQDIVHDLVTGQPKGLITEWQEYGVENGFINYKSYCMGAR